MLGLLLTVKEEVGFFVATFGIYLFIFVKNWRRFGFATFILGTLYTLLVVHWLIPAIGGEYIYFGYGQLGNTPTQVAKNLMLHPIVSIGLLTDSPVKVNTLHQTLWPWAYLPLLSPLSFLLLIEQFFSRFIDQTYPIRWTFHFHYSAILAGVNAVGTIFSLRWLMKKYSLFRKPLSISLIGLLIIILTIFQQPGHSAIIVTLKPQFWQREKWMDQLDTAISLVPEEASIATQNNLLPHLATRRPLYQYADRNLAEFQLLDFHTGQSDYNFWEPSIKNNWQHELEENIIKGHYKVVYNQDDVWLVQKVIN